MCLSLSSSVFLSLSASLYVLDRQLGIILQCSAHVFAAAGATRAIKGRLHPISWSVYKARLVRLFCDSCLSLAACKLPLLTGAEEDHEEAPAMRLGARLGWSLTVIATS